MTKSQKYAIIKGELGSILIRCKPIKPLDIQEENIMTKWMQILMDEAMEQDMAEWDKVLEESFEEDEKSVECQKDTVN